MPYIKFDVKEDFKSVVTKLRTSSMRNPGELNYLITELCLAYLSPEIGPVSYQDYNDIVGALESAKLEFYRRSVVPFEDQKILQNGDVYPTTKSSIKE